MEKNLKKSCDIDAKMDMLVELFTDNSNLTGKVNNLKFKPMLGISLLKDIENLNNILIDSKTMDNYVSNIAQILQYKILFQVLF